MPDKAKSQPCGRLTPLKPVQSSKDVMKTTAERSNLKDPHAESRRSAADNSDNEFWADIFNDEIIYVVDICDGDTRLGSCKILRDRQLEAYHANGRLIGIFPDFTTALSAWTSSADDYYGEVIIAVEGDQ
jgi:hypothetical protein